MTAVSTSEGQPVARGFPALHDARYPAHRIAERLEPFLGVIVEKIRPEKIILFGSYAYGEPDEHSDVDLLVVRKNIASEKASNLEIRDAFESVPGPLFSFTILSKTPERIAERLAVHSAFYEEIVGKGLELYAAA
ncbi:MAG: nucleotidyltransferase domain-containing protein [Limisphaerales bacterium]